jgi:hypothetical protein
MPGEKKKAESEVEKPDGRHDGSLSMMNTFGEDGA